MSDAAITFWFTFVAVVIAGAAVWAYLVAGAIRDWWRDRRGESR